MPDHYLTVPDHGFLLQLAEHDDAGHLGGRHQRRHARIEPEAADVRDDERTEAVRRQPERLDLEAHVHRDPLEQSEDRTAERPRDSVQDILVPGRLDLIAAARAPGLVTDFARDVGYRARVRIADDCRSHTGVAANLHGHHDVDVLTADDGAAANETVHFGRVERHRAGKHGHRHVDHGDLLAFLAL